LTGIEAAIELELPDELSYAFKSMLFRQVTESLTNVEKHAAATRGQLSMKAVDGAVHGLVIDNGVALWFPSATAYLTTSACSP